MAIKRDLRTSISAVLFVPECNTNTPTLVNLSQADWIKCKVFTENPTLFVLVLRQPPGTIIASTIQRDVLCLWNNGNDVRISIWFRPDIQIHSDLSITFFRNNCCFWCDS